MRRSTRSHTQAEKPHGQPSAAQIALNATLRPSALQLAIDAGLAKPGTRPTAGPIYSPEREAWLQQQQAREEWLQQQAQAAARPQLTIVGGPGTGLRSQPAPAPRPAPRPSGGPLGFSRIRDGQVEHYPTAGSYSPNNRQLNGPQNIGSTMSPTATMPGTAELARRSRTSGAAPLSQPNYPAAQGTPGAPSTEPDWAEGGTEPQQPTQPAPTTGETIPGGAPGTEPDWAEQSATGGRARRLTLTATGRARF